MLRSITLAISVVNVAIAASQASNFQPLHHLAGISPYFEPGNPSLDPNPPQGCNVTRAAYLVRHAAISGNDFDYEEYNDPFADKLENTTVDWSKAGPLSFLGRWKRPFDDDDLEKLTKIGELESWVLGTTVRIRYPSFKAPKAVWTSTAERTELSAKSFIQGLAAGGDGTKKISVPESEAEGANSLTPYKGCPKYDGAAGSDESTIYREKYTKPIIARFQSYAPGFNFTDKDIYGMQQLCGYETVIHGQSQFCSLELFTPDDWLAFEYAEDIRYHYNVGYGLPAAGAVGFPWLEASAEKLLADEADQDIYVSFTHRELPPMVVVALGLFNNTAYTGANNVNATMPTNIQNHNRAWKSSHILPFLTNIAIERMTCDSYGYEAGDYFRVLVNNNPQQMPDCSGGPGESCPKSRFDKFVEGRGELFGGFTEKCQPEYKNSTDHLTIYKRY